MRNHLPGFARQKIRIAQRKPETCTTSGLKLSILLHNPWYKIAPAIVQSINDIDFEYSKDAFYLIPLLIFCLEKDIDKVLGVTI